MNKITIKDVEINITGTRDDDYLNLTDLARISKNIISSNKIR